MQVQRLTNEVHGVIPHEYSVTVAASLSACYDV